MLDGLKGNDQVSCFSVFTDLRGPFLLRQELHQADYFDLIK